ncbi:MAG: endonuclease III domain-containing protein [Proteobacteria bacterium]|nr:endonuclease III domain-containing protein [Pseudomonadota bacterium]MBU1648698.1 endonuclease III domain-containing protein [Pseudomonadota bacterium]MBU1986573.1 endonuclease III domain-containing protein [Pseudomonadota bacterium]
MIENKFTEIYSLLYEHFGPQGWWPGDSPFEIIVGAVLTQNTNWGNVCKAISQLKEAGVLSFPALAALPVDELAQLIKPSGYFNIKSQRLKNLLQMINERYNGNLERFLAEDLFAGREALLSVKGIGPETADSILLYAANHPIFVVDTYTHRIFSRHLLVAEESDYYSLQEAFHDRLPAQSVLFNEYHALIVTLGKDYCRKNNPRCEQCPLQGV